MGRTPTEMIHCEKRFCVKDFFCLGLLFLLQLNIATSKPAISNKIINYQDKVENLVDEIIDYIAKYYGYIESEYKCIPEKLLGRLVDTVKNSIDCVDFNEEVFRKGIINFKNYKKNEKSCLVNAQDDVRYVMADIDPLVNYCPPNGTKNILIGNIKTSYENSFKIYLKNNTKFLEKETQNMNELIPWESLGTQIRFALNNSRFVRKVAEDGGIKMSKVKNLTGNFVNFDKERVEKLGRDVVLYIGDKVDENGEPDFSFLDNVDWEKSPSPFKYVSVINVKNLVPLITSLLPQLTELLNTFLNSISYYIYPTFADDESLTASSLIYPIPYDDNGVVSFSSRNRTISSENAGLRPQLLFENETTSINNAEKSEFGDGKLRVLFPPYFSKNLTKTNGEVEKDSGNDVLKSLRNEMNTESTVPDSITVANNKTAVQDKTAVVNSAIIVQNNITVQDSTTAANSATIILTKEKTVSDIATTVPDIITVANNETAVQDSTTVINSAITVLNKETMVPDSATTAQNSTTVVNSETKVPDSTAEVNKKKMVSDSATTVQNSTAVVRGETAVPDITTVINSATTLQGSETVVSDITEVRNSETTVPGSATTIPVSTNAVINSASTVMNNGTTASDTATKEPDSAPTELTSKTVEVVSKTTVLGTKITNSLIVAQPTLSNRAETSKPEEGLGINSEIPQTTELYSSSETLLQTDQFKRFNNKSGNTLTGVESTIINNVNKNTETEDTSNNNTLPTDVTQTEEDIANKILTVDIQTTSSGEAEILEHESESTTKENEISTEVFSSTDSKTTLNSVGTEENLKYTKTESQTSETEKLIEHTKQNSNEFKIRYGYDKELQFDADSIVDEEKEVPSDEYLATEAYFDTALVDVHSKSKNGRKNFTVHEVKLPPGGKKPGSSPKLRKESPEVYIRIDPSSINAAAPPTSNSTDQNKNLNDKFDEDFNEDSDFDNSDIIQLLDKAKETSSKDTSTKVDNKTRSFDDKKQDNKGTEVSKLVRNPTDVQSATKDTNSSGKPVEGETEEKDTSTESDFKEYFKKKEVSSTTSVKTRLIPYFPTQHQHHTTTEISEEHHHNPADHEHGVTKIPIEKKIDILVKWLVNAAKNFFSEYYDEFSDVDVSDLDEEWELDSSQLSKRLLGPNRLKERLKNKRKKKPRNKNKKERKPFRNN